MNAKTIEIAYKRSYRKWFKTALGILHDEDEVKDVIQATLLLLLENPPKQYNEMDATPFDMYINGCVRFQCLCKLRKTVWERNKLAGYYEQYALFNTPPKPTDEVTMWRPDGLFLTDEQARVLERERLLQGDEKLICKLYFREGKSIYYISKKTQKRPETIQRYLRAIRKVLVSVDDEHLIKNEERFLRSLKLAERVQGVKNFFYDKKRELDIAQDARIKEVQFHSLNAKTFRALRKQQLMDEWLQTQTVVRL